MNNLLCENHLPHFNLKQEKKMQKKFTNATVTATPAQILRRQKQLWQGRWKYSLPEMPCISAKS